MVFGVAHEGLVDENTPMRSPPLPAGLSASCRSVLQPVLPNARSIRGSAISRSSSTTVSWSGGAVAGDGDARGFGVPRVLQHLVGVPAGGFAARACRPRSAGLGRAIVITSFPLPPAGGNEVFQGSFRSCAEAVEVDAGPAPVAEHDKLVAGDSFGRVALGGVALVRRSVPAGGLVPEVAMSWRRGFATGGHLRSPR